MRHLSLATVALFLVACSGSQPVEAAPAPLRSGFYEGFVLAVSASGRVVGHFDMEQGQGVVKRCIFDFVGTVKGRQAAIRTVDAPALAGRIAAQDGGDVTFSMAHVGDLPGCGLVVPPEAETAAGVELSGIRTGAWTDLAAVKRARVAFSATPSGPAGRAYVVKGDVLGILERRGSQVHVVFPSERDTWAQGWVAATDLIPLAP